MEKVRCLGKKFTIGYNSEAEPLTKGEFTTDQWGVDRVMIIPTEQGYKLALKVFYYNESLRGISSELCEIKFNENGVPYIDFGSGEFPYNEGYPLMVYKMGDELFEYHISWDKGVFDFRDPDTTTRQGPNVHLYHLVVGTSQREFFDDQDTYQSVSLNTAGLILLMRYIQDPRNREILDKKFTRPSKEEVCAFKDDIRLTLEKVMKKAGTSKGYSGSEIRELEDKLYILEDLMHRPLDTTPPIKLNFAEYASSFAPNGSQFGN